MSIFQFKQFQVDQTGCAMKINTDGILLATMVQAKQPESILDIGTGTGVISLMLAQRFETAQIDAVEIEPQACARAAENFKASKYADRLSAYECAIETYIPTHQYDLIVSNPPFFVNDLKNIDYSKGLARHTHASFFDDLLNKVSELLKPEGVFWVVLPVKQALDLIQKAAYKQLHQVYQTNIHSDANKPTIRMVIALSKEPKSFQSIDFYIYQKQQVHTEEYNALLKDFFL